MKNKLLNHRSAISTLFVGVALSASAGDANKGSIVTICYAII